MMLMEICCILPVENILSMNGISTVKMTTMRAATERKMAIQVPRDSSGMSSAREGVTVRRAITFSVNRSGACSRPLFPASSLMKSWLLF